MVPPNNNNKNNAFLSLAWSVGCAADKKNALDAKRRTRRRKKPFV